MEALSPIPSLEDLKLTIHESTLVFPPQPTDRKTVYLSNVDMFFNDHVKTAHFFEANPDFSTEDVARRLKMALEKVLVPYDFAAGRLKVNAKLDDRLELDCNAAGAGFVVASSEVSLDDIRDGLGHPNLGFLQLAARRVDGIATDDELLLVIQLTSFTCGGFAIGMAMNHIMFDGMGSKLFIENLVSQTFDDKPLAVVPIADRTLLAARSPPSIKFPHPEFLPIYQLPIKKESTPQILDYRIFKLSPIQVAKLKDKAKAAAKANTRISSFSVMAALMWRCKALSDHKDESKDAFSTLINIINIRERVSPPLPMSYNANAVLPMGVSAKYEELENWPFGKLVELIAERPKEMTDEYAKSAIDWLEVNRGVIHGDLIIFSWMRLGQDQVTYPWGMPMYSCPLGHTHDDIGLIFPDAVDGWISSLMVLPPEKMKRFEAVFQEFFV